MNGKKVSALAALILMTACVGCSKNTAAEPILKTDNIMRESTDNNAAPIAAHLEAEENVTVNEAIAATGGIDEQESMEELKDNSFYDVEYGTYSGGIQELADCVFDGRSITLTFKGEYQVLVSYQSNSGCLRLLMPECRCPELALPIFSATDFFSDIVVAESEEGADIVAYVSEELRKLAVFDCRTTETDEYNVFEIEIIKE